MPVKVDLHIHSHQSWDGFSSVEQNIEMAKLKNYRVIGCVEHDQFQEALDPFEVINDITVLGGAELSVKPFHVLVYGKISDHDKQEVLKKLNILTCIEMIEYLNDIGLYTILAHPFRIKEIIRSGGFRLIDEMASKAFLVEGRNGRSFLSNIVSSFRIDKGKSVAGSDSHHVFEIGNAYALVDDLDTSNIDSLFESLRKADKKLVYSPSLYSLLYSRYLKFKERRKKIW